MTTAREALGCGLISVWIVACAGTEREAPQGRESVLEPVDPPAAAGALAPWLAPDGEGAWLSWLEPVEGEENAKKNGGQGEHRLQVARFDGSAWGPARTVHQGDGMFVNWADTPSVAVEPDGELIVHWLEKLGEGPYDYGVRLARSTDGGTSWQERGWLHDDRSATEHGFVTLVPDPGGTLAVWLDGRAMADGGPMSLRAGAVDRAPLTGDLLDDRVCECCSTTAVATTDGVIVAYRDRSDDEIRDISVIRGDASGWSEPYSLSDDRWRIPGCPVNGPALAADGRRVAAAWFTAGDGRPKVRAALSSDGGRSFGHPVELADGTAVGRVDVVLEPGGAALVSWIGRFDGGEEGGEGTVRAMGAVWLRRVAPDGGIGSAIALAETSTARASGFPRLHLHGDEIWLAWVETSDPPRLRFGRLPRTAVPATLPTPES